MKEFKFNKDVSDKYLPKTIYKKGSVHTFEDARAEELLKAGVGEIVGKSKEVETIETAAVEKVNVETAVPKRKRKTKAE